MSIEAALYTKLTTDSGVAALIGARLYPNVVPQTAPLPSAAYQVITTERDYHQAGQSSIAVHHVQITIEAASKGSANAVAAAIRAALSGFKGTVGAVAIGGIFLENEYDGYNLDTEITTVRQDYSIEWKEV